jgi:quinolinate synthase
VTYVNASAAVEAEADICCTSANAKKIIEALGVPRVIMLADEYLAGSTAAQTPSRSSPGKALRGA